MRYSKELLKGGTPLLVMSVLDGKDLYGYRIIRELEVRSENVFQMSEGTLYPILHALEQEGCLKSDWRTVDGRRRKYYHLTDKGRRQFAEKKAEFLSYTREVTPGVGVCIEVGHRKKKSICARRCCWSPTRIPKPRCSGSWKTI